VNARDVYDGDVSVFARRRCVDSNGRVLNDDGASPAPARRACSTRSPFFSGGVLKLGRPGKAGSGGVYGWCLNGKTKSQTGSS
jgi:hypothetical protein